MKYKYLNLTDEEFAEPLYFVAVGCKPFELIHIAARSISIGSEIAEYYFRRDFVIEPSGSCGIDTPASLRAVFEANNVKKGYIVGNSKMPIHYSNRKDIIDEVLKDL